MIIKGTNAIRGISSINTRHGGPRSESNTFLDLYKLATEKEHLTKKLQWIMLQKYHTERRLSEITRMAHAVEKRTTREATSRVDFRNEFIGY